MNNQDAESSFWLIAAAVKRFYEDHGTLPVSGGLPDMKAQSDVYIRLQNLYKSKARQDASEVLATVRGMECGADIDSAEVELFCTNARFIRLINGADVAPKSLAQVTGKQSVGAGCGKGSLLSASEANSWLHCRTGIGK